MATFIGQSIGWYRLDQGAGLIGATIGAVVILLIWRLIAGKTGDVGPSAEGPRRWL